MADDSEFLSRRAYAGLQPCLCYFGFGLQPDIDEVFRYLKGALPHNLTARSIYQRLLSVFGYRANLDLTFQGNVDQ